MAEENFMCLDRNGKACAHSIVLMSATRTSGPIDMLSADSTAFSSMPIVTAHANVREVCSQIRQKFGELNLSGESSNWVGNSVNNCTINVHEGKPESLSFGNVQFRNGC